VKFDVCAAVVGDLKVDARVWKQARSLRGAGYSLKLVGCRYEIDSRQHRVDEGIHVVEVPLGTRAGTDVLKARAAALAAMSAEIIGTSARCYHAHNVHIALPSLLAAVGRRAQLVYDAHELYGHVRPEFGALATLGARASRAAEHLMCRRANAVITTNPSRAQVLAQRHGREDIAVLRNVPALRTPRTDTNPGFPPGDVLLYQGGIYATARAFRETIEAVAMLDGLQFVVLGFGRERDLRLITEWAQEFGVADRVHLMGARPFDELVDTAAAATIGLVPIKARGPNSVLGDTNKLHEYLMAGLPVVGSNLPEIAAVCRTGEPPVGELFDPAAPESIAAAIRRILVDREGYQRRRAQARELAVSCYNWDQEQGRLLELYDHLLGAPESTR
jgi:glycosyltransferase involved in cell wall biosynthesis